MLLPLLPLLPLLLHVTVTRCGVDRVCCWRRSAWLRALTSAQGIALTSPLVSTHARSTANLMGSLKCSKAAQSQIKGEWLSAAAELRGYTLPPAVPLLAVPELAAGRLPSSPLCCCRSSASRPAGKFNSLFASGLRAYMFGRS